MSVTSRPFAYNPAATPIPGTTQSGELTIGTPTYGFPATGLDWWNGPLEAGSTGWIIAKPVPSNTQPTPIPGVFASVGFLRSSSFADGSFATLVNEKFGQIFPLDAGGDLAAKGWLTANGYWTNYP